MRKLAIILLALGFIAPARADERLSACARAAIGTRRRKSRAKGITPATVTTASTMYTARHPCSDKIPARITGQIAPER